MLYRLVICSFIYKQPLRLTFIIDQRSIFCVNREFNIRVFDTLAFWCFKNEEFGETVLITIHIGLLTIVTLALTNPCFLFRSSDHLIFWNWLHSQAKRVLSLQSEMSLRHSKGSLRLCGSYFWEEGGEILAGDAEVHVSLLTFMLFCS